MKLPKYKKESDEVLFFCNVKRLALQNNMGS